MKEDYIMDADEVFKRMNVYGKKEVPFFFAIDYQQERGLFIANPLQQQDILFEIKGKGNAMQLEAGDFPAEPFFCKKRMDSGQYRDAFHIVQKGLLRGDSFLTNLTGVAEITTNLSLRDIFLHASALYKLFIPDEFVCFSPECFVKISNGIIHSYPMKGTIRAEIPQAEQRILEDEKETAEHNTIVDLIRNDLGQVSERVWVKRFRYIDRLHTNNGDILQVSSEICGELSKDYLDRFGEIFRKMLPAGSICGAPKISTLRIIRKAERAHRGWYTGVCGYFDGRNLDSGVMIRCLQKTSEDLFFHSGGGITAKSNCRSEYQELADKVYLPFDLPKTFVETIQVYNGHLCRLSFHKERMKRTALHFFGTLPEWTLCDEQVPDALKIGMAKCRVVYSSTIRSVVFTAYEIHPVHSLRLVEDDMIDYTYKSSDRQSLNKLASHKGTCDGVLIVKNGCITDTVYTNVVFRKGCEYFTPDTPLLKGTRRRALLKSEQIKECRITPANLPEYDAVYLINAFLDLAEERAIPINRIITGDSVL